MAELNVRQRLFVKEYLKDLNATQACIRAGYSAKGADVAGPRLLGHVGVRAEIDKAIAKRSEKIELSANQVLENIRRISESAEEDGQFGPAIKGQELLGKHLKLFTEVIEAKVALHPLRDVPTQELVEFIKKPGV